MMRNIEIDGLNFHGAVQRIVDYMWRDERRHYSECLLDEGIDEGGDWGEEPEFYPDVCSDHIFRSVAILNRWLAEQPEEEVAS